MPSGGEIGVGVLRRSGGGRGRKDVGIGRCHRCVAPPRARDGWPSLTWGAVRADHGYDQWGRCTVFLDGGRGAGGEREEVGVVLSSVARPRTG